MDPNPQRDDSGPTDDLVIIGEVVKPHGIRGEVKVYSYSERPENFIQYKRIILHKPATEASGTYIVLNSRVQGKLAILQLQGVTSREAAAALQGSRIFLRKNDFPPLAADEYYWHQLEGLLVKTDTGRNLGRVARLFSTPAHDIMVVSGQGREYMIPLVDEVIRVIDVQKRELLIAPPPGLLEINETY